MSFCFTVVRGQLSSEPQVRTLESGTRLATLQVTVREDGQPTVSLPITVWDPPTFVEELQAGDEVVGIGRVNRRFYGASAGPRQSRVEIVARELIKGTDKRKVGAALRRARADLDDAVERG